MHSSSYYLSIFLENLEEHAEENTVQTHRGSRVTLNLVT